MTDLAAVHLSQSRAAPALDYLRKSLVIYEETADERGMARALYGIGLGHRTLGRVDQALEYFNRSLALSQASGASVNNSQTVLILNGIGSIHRYQGRHELALEFYQKSRALSEELNDK
ncbi:MAG TPA: tetratricopeptide repeat protein [Blastocatellia bacterium]|nr:tetratricopeptide repeat protein [Blastocatellia bacterium]